MTTRQTLEGFSLSPQQERLWSLSLARGEQGPSSWCAVELLGSVDTDRLARALDRVVRRHEILRTELRSLPGMSQPLQVVSEDGPSLERCTASRIEEVVEAAEGTGGPALTLCEMEGAGEAPVLVIALPPASTDASSLERLVGEIAASYATDGEHEEGEEPIQYSAVAEWLHELLEDEFADAGRAFWDEAISGPLTGATLPFARHEPGSDGFEIARVRAALDRSESDRLEAVADRLGVSIEAVLLSAWQIVLQRLTDGALPAVGVTFDGRTDEELEDAVGLFARSAPLPVPADERTAAEARIREVDAALTEASGWQECYLWRGLAAERPGDPPGHLPFAFSVEPAFGTHRAADVTFRTIDRSAPVDRFDLSLGAYSAESGWTLELRYDAARYRRSDVERIPGWVRTVVDGLCRAGDRPVAWLPLLAPEERRQLLVDWNDTRAEHPGPRTLDGLFFERAAHAPEAVALVAGEDEVSYGALAERSARWAGKLRELGVGRGDRVALMVPRGVDAVVGVLAVLRAGAAFMPIDSEHPDERIAAILDRGGAEAILTVEDLAGRLTGRAEPVVAMDGEAIDDRGDEVDDAPAPRHGPDDLAYVIHTSGSTGEPKGVMVPHRAIVNRVGWMHRVYPLQPHDRVLHKTPLVFDASIWEIFCPLMAGAGVALASPDAHRDPAALVEEAREAGATVIQFVPSMLRFFVDAGGARLPGLERVFSGGEALPADLVEGFAADGAPELVNLYGPTETAIDATSRPCPEPVSGPIAPVGRPIDNDRVVIADARLRSVPAGIVGELTVAGEGLALGYLGRPGATAERFVPDPFGPEPGARLYRTGDLAVIAPSGEVEYRGRVDQQVKLRGVRIELGEIEAVLARHASVHEAAAGVVDDTIVAWVSLAEPAAEGAERVPELRRFLEERLPEVMVPAVFVELDALPKSISGKIDRQSLPAPDRAETRREGRGAAPRTPIEDLVASIWSELLEVDRPRVDDDFFAFGGHSLLAMRLVGRVRELTGVNLSVRGVFETSTLARMAALLESRLGEDGGRAAPPLEPVPRDGALPLSFAQQRLFFLDQLEPGSLAYILPAAFRVVGRLDLEALEGAVTEIVRRHEALRSRLLLESGQPVQRVREPYRVRVPVKRVTLTGGGDTGDDAAGSAGAEVERLVADELARPFDLASGELLRLTLLELPDGEQVLVLAMHHVAGDGWSTDVLVHELSALYPALLRDEPAPLDELTIQYPDFAAWQRRWLSGQELEAEVGYWRSRLAGAPPVLELPTDRPRPETEGFAGDGVLVRMPTDLSTEITDFARQEGASLFMTLLSAFSALLYRLSGQDDMVIGTDVANRSRTATEELIGFFVNLLPLRVRLDDGPDFRTLVQRVRDVALDAYGHQDLPFDKLVEELRPERRPGAMPIVQVLFVMQNLPNRSLDLPGVTLEPLEVPTTTSKFDVALFVWETDDGLVAFWNYKTDLFDRDTILRMSRQLEMLLGDAVRRPDEPIDRLALQGEAERKRQSMQKNERRQAKLDKLMKAAPAPTATTPVELVRTEPLSPARPLPLVAEPVTDGVDAVEWARGQREVLEERLLEHGAILFRGFDLPTVEDFEAFAAAVCPDLFAEYGDLPAAPEGEKIYESTPYPADKSILFHNESSHMHRWPLKQFFYCAIPAEQGGVTPLIDCREVYRRLDPEIVQRFRERGLLYVRTFSPGLDVSWQQFFKTDDRSAVEAFCERAGIELTWRDGDRLSIRQPAIAVAEHPKTGEPVFFNQLQLHHISCLDPATRESMTKLFGPDELPRNVLYGDGTPIEDELMEQIGALYDEIEVTFQWQKGDVVMVDNMLVAHARRPFVGQRRIAVAMGDLVYRDEVVHGS